MTNPQPCFVTKVISYAPGNKYKQGHDGSISLTYIPKVNDVFLFADFRMYIC